ELEHAESAEAIAHRADALCIDIRPRDERVVTGAHMPAQLVVVLAQRAHEVHRILGLLRDAPAAIHIDGERDIAKLGDHARAAFRMVIEARRFMDDQHAGTPAAAFGIGEIAVERRIAGGIGQGLDLHGAPPVAGPQVNGAAYKRAWPRAAIRLNLDYL